MTNREQLLRDGFIIFPSVVPEDLRKRSEEIINATSAEPCFVWKDPVATEFRQWGQQFLEDQQMAFEGWITDIHTFNRRTGTDATFWHTDDQAWSDSKEFGSYTTRRVFCCTYFTSTTDGRAPLRVIPGSHHGGYEEFRVRFRDYKWKVSDVPPYQGYNKEQALAEYPDMWAPHPDQAVLEVPAGSMIVVDERVMHGTSINFHTERRPMALWWLTKCQEDRNREDEFRVIQ